LCAVLLTKLRKSMLLCQITLGTLWTLY